MRIVRWVIATGVIAISLLLAGCFGTETGNPPSVALGLTARTSDPSIASLDAAASGARVQSAWVALADVRAIEGTACDHVATTAAIELAVADAVTGEALGDLPSGESCGVRAALAAAVEPPPGAPPALAGRSLLVTGILADGRRFEITSALELDLLVQGAPFSTEADDALLLALDLAAWLRNVDLAALSEDADGVVRVGPSGPAAVRDGFEASVASGLELFADVDADGALSAAEESAGPLATGHRAP